MSKPHLSPSLAPVIARLEALCAYARRPDLGPGDLDEPLIAEIEQIRTLIAQAVIDERAAATGEVVAFPPSRLSALLPWRDEERGHQEPARPDAGGPRRL